MAQPPPGRTAVRPPWHRLPPAVRREVEARFGAPVELAADQTGGFTPGVAARLTLTNGGRAFVKAVPVVHPVAPKYAHEATVAAGLGPTAPAPTLHWHGTVHAWTVLVFADVPGRHPNGIGTAWELADPAAITGYATAFAGYWTRMSREPAPEGVPHLRGYQHHAAIAALSWLRHRLAHEPHPGPQRPVTSLWAWVSGAGAGERCFVMRCSGGVMSAGLRSGSPFPPRWTYA